MHFHSLTCNGRNPLLPCCEHSRHAPKACDPAKSLWSTPKCALDEPSRGSGVTEQSWQEKPAWSTPCEPQTHLHPFPLVTCPSCLELNIFFYLLQDSQVFLLLPWGKKKSLFWEHVGFKPTTVSALPARRTRATSPVPERLAHISPHSACMIRGLSPTKALPLRH